MKSNTRFFYLIVFILFIQIISVSVAAAATKIMPLGDSITQGYMDGIIDPDPGNNRVGYREKLYSDLVDEGYDVDFVGSLNQGLFADPWHEGQSGGRADGIRDSVYSLLVDNPADIILLHIGTNDFSDGQSAAAVRDEINGILNEIDEYEDDYSTEVMVILALIINRQDPSTLEGQKTTQLNFLLQTLVNTRSAGGDQIRAVNHEIALNYPGDMADPWHPNMTGYNKMADVWFSALEQILPEPEPEPDPPNNSSSSSGGCFIGTITE